MTINGVRITIAALAAEIHDCGAYLRRNFAKGELSDGEGEFDGTDARLQVQGGSYSLHTGSADYDQDHRGAWGCASIPRGCTWHEARDIARELLDDCANSAADMGECDE